MLEQQAAYEKFDADNKMYLFVATTISLVIVAYLGYHRFIAKPGNKTKAA